MKILIIKLSSLGDLLHVFPALADVQKAIGHLDVDWVVEESFQEVPAWNPLVSSVIPLGLRRIKKQGWWRLTSLQEIFRTIKKIRATRYDLIIDAQGLYKSAVLAFIARGRRVGFGRGASRERVSWLYHQSYFMSWDEHAVTRLRGLFAQALHYHYDASELHFNMGDWQGAHSKTLIFVHATTWPTKHYPVEYWHQLAQLAVSEGYQVELPQVTAIEEARALKIKGDLSQVRVLPKMSLTSIRDRLRAAGGVVSVDTGLAHIAGAMNVPNVALYGPTNPKNIGTWGQHQVHLAAKFECAPCWLHHCTHPERIHEPTPPCYRMIPPSVVWERFKALMVLARGSSPA